MADLKSIKKGDKVILRMFTGALVEAKTVEMADAKKIGFTNKKGIKMVFDKKTGKQVSPEPKNEKYANYITEYDEQVEAEALMKKNGGKKPAAPKATAKKAEKPAPKKATKSKKKAADPEPEDESEYNEGEFEEVDDGDEEEA